MSEPNTLVLTYPTDLPKTYYRGIGEIIARTALFESLLMEAIAEIAGIADPKKKRVLLMGMSVKPRLGVLKTLTSRWVAGKAQRELLSIIKDAGDLITLRHQIAHGTWGFTPNSKRLRLTYIEEAKDAYLPKSSPVLSRQLLIAAKAIRDLTIRLDAVITDLKSLPPASQDKSQ